MADEKVARLLVAVAPFIVALIPDAGALHSRRGCLAMEK